MKIEKITYQKAFPIGPFLQEKLGLEIILDGTDPEYAYSEARKIVDGWHKENNPHLEGTTITDVEHTKDGWAIPVFSKDAQTNEELEITRQFEKAKADLAAIEYQEDAMLYVKNNGWSLNPDIKNIANSKPKRPTNE